MCDACDFGAVKVRLSPRASATITFSGEGATREGLERLIDHLKLTLEAVPSDAEVQAELERKRDEALEAAEAKKPAAISALERLRKRLDRYADGDPDAEVIYNLAGELIGKIVLYEGNS